MLRHRAGLGDRPRPGQRAPCLRGGGVHHRRGAGRGRACRRTSWACSGRPSAPTSRRPSPPNGPARWPGATSTAGWSSATSWPTPACRRRSWCSSGSTWACSPSWAGSRRPPIGDGWRRSCGPPTRRRRRRWARPRPGGGTMEHGLARGRPAWVGPAVRVVVCRPLGSLDHLAVEEREPPGPGPGQVVVAVRAAGVNYVDGLMCEGRYQIKPPTPYVPGGEIAGEVVAVGEGVAGFAVGQRVLAMTGLGAFAEQVVVAARRRHIAIPGRLGVRPGGVVHPELRHHALRPHPAHAAGGGGDGARPRCRRGHRPGRRRRRRGPGCPRHRRGVVARASSMRPRGHGCGSRPSPTRTRTSRPERASSPAAGRRRGGGPRRWPPQRAALRALAPFGRFLVLGFASGPIAVGAPQPGPPAQPRP